MAWPKQTVEAIPAEEFSPSFCPWPECEAHRPPRGQAVQFHLHGSYARKADGRVVPRYRCVGCGRTFSQQTFSCTYYLKRPELLGAVAAGLVAGSAHRQLGRSLGCAASSVTRLSARLGRHGLLLQAWMLARLDGIDEPVVYDDFETFAHSQDRPLGIGSAVGQSSWFVYSLQWALHRRGGRRSPAQKTRRKTADLPTGAYSRAFQSTLDLLLAKTAPGRVLQLVSDDHPGYRRGLGRHPLRSRVDHRRFANPHRPFKGAPRSRKAIERDRQLFAVDLLHMLWRHSQAHHRRETIAFGRRHNALIERAALFIVWRNVIKGRSERKPDPTTPAMRLGIARSPWNWARVLAQRLFPTRLAVPRSWMQIYARDLLTPEIGRNARHRLAHAF